MNFFEARNGHLAERIEGGKREEGKKIESKFEVMVEV